MARYPSRLQSLQHFLNKLLILALFVAPLWAAQQAFAAPPSVERSVKVGGNVYEIVFNPEDQRVYAAVTGGNVINDEGEVEQATPGIVALDGETLDIVNKIETGKTRPFGLALNPTTQKLYATDTINGTVGVYDVDTGKEVALISSPGDESSHLREAVVDEATNTIYVTAVGGFTRGDSPAPQSAVWVIDGETDKLTDVISDPVQTATGLAIDSKNERLYVSDLANNQVAEIDLKTHEVLCKFASAAKPEGPVKPGAEQKAPSDTVNLEIDTDNGLLYAINQESGGVAVIDLADGKIVDSVKTGDGALSAHINPKTGDLYVANRGDGTVSVVDDGTHYVTAHLSSGTYPQTVAIDPESGRVYVSNKAKGKGRHGPEDAPIPYEPGGNTITLIQP